MFSGLRSEWGPYRCAASSAEASLAEQRLHLPQGEGLPLGRAHLHHPAQRHALDELAR